LDPVCPKFTPGDFDDNGNLDLEDFVKFCMSYTGTPPHNLTAIPPADFDDDDDVDLVDFIKFFYKYRILN